jgi:diphthamide biosynthesis protein 3
LMPDDTGTAVGEEERVYDTVDLEEMEFEEEDQMYYYQCPCGDMFEISVEDLEKGERIARCPSCSLILSVNVSDTQSTAASGSGGSGKDGAAQPVQGLSGEVQVVSSSTSSSATAEGT